METVADKAQKCAQKFIEDMGYELVGVEYAKEDGLMCLTYYICKSGGVSLDDCEAVSQVIDQVVEQANVAGGQYCLCVSSPGERPLKSERDFERNMGLDVMVELTSPEKGKKKKYRGKLVAYSGEAVLINDGKAELSFSVGNIKYVKPYIGF